MSLSTGALVLLALIAVASIVQTLCLALLALNGLRTKEEIERLGRQITHDIQPLIEDLTRISRNAAEISDRGLTQTRRLDEAVGTPRARSSRSSRRRTTWSFLSRAAWPRSRRGSASSAAAAACSADSSTESAAANPRTTDSSGRSFRRFIAVARHCGPASRVPSWCRGCHLPPNCLLSLDPTVTIAETAGVGGRMESLDVTVRALGMGTDPSRLTLDRAWIVGQAGTDRLDAFGSGPGGRRT